METDPEAAAMVAVTAVSVFVGVSPLPAERTADAPLEEFSLTTLLGNLPNRSAVEQIFRTSSQMRGTISIKGSLSTRAQRT